MGFLLPRYHEFEEEEKRYWESREFRGVLASQDAVFLHRVAELLPVHADSPSAGLRSVVATLVDVKYEVLYALYLSVAEGLQQVIRSMADRSSSVAMLLLFSSRMAVRAMREKSEHCIRLGLVAIAIENLAGGDMRDTITARLVFRGDVTGQVDRLLSFFPNST